MTVFRTDCQSALEILVMGWWSQMNDVMNMATRSEPALIVRAWSKARPEQWWNESGGVASESKANGADASRCCYEQTPAH